MHPSMLEEIVTWVDERFGRRAAWLAAILTILMIFAGVALIFVLLAR